MIQSSIVSHRLPSHVLKQAKTNLLLHLNTLEPSVSLIIKTLKMSEFHFEDPDLKNSTLEIGFLSCAIEKDNFIDSQLKGRKFERKTRSLFKLKFGNKGHICVVVAVAVLLAKGPYSPL